MLMKWLTMKFQSKRVRKQYIDSLMDLYGSDDMKAKRIDANQNQIVKLFRDLGASVHVLSHVGQGFPDIAVGVAGRTFLFEIKDGKKPPSARRLTADEKKFHEEWRGHVGIITSVDDVIDLINRVRMHQA